MKWFRHAIVTLSLSLCAACGDEDDNQGELAIAGTWLYEYESEHTITSTTWLEKAPWGTSLYLITQYDNDDNYLIAQNDESNTYNPKAWSRFDWTTYDEKFYYCQIASAASDEQEARRTTAPDPSDPANGGCGDFAWTELDPQ